MTNRKRPDELTRPDQMSMKAIKREILRERIMMVAQLSVTAAAGALGYQMHLTHGLAPALAVTGAIIAVAVIIEEL